MGLCRFAAGGGGGGRSDDGLRLCGPAASALGVRAPGADRIVIPVICEPLPGGSHVPDAGPHLPFHTHVCAHDIP